MTVRRSPDPAEQLRQTMPVPPASVPGPLRLEFGVLADEADERMSVQFEILTPTTTKFDTPRGPRSIAEVCDDGVVNGLVVVVACAGGPDPVRVLNQKREIIYRAGLVDGPGPGRASQIKIAVTVTQNRVLRFSEEVTLGIDPGDVTG